ncbi:cytochrome c oxidase subunit 3 [Albimonas donghaensis]|uniref:Cytochrome c oxidase subunit 3 n=1 Tax=Albimonas donghaensis TaxID=356660 RepID=A0A1H2VRI3_9RHOB|nr:cytochrome c oxidase subunit 3 [Albimonas donghaensis]MAS42538.1 cytochrome c oxidase subunit 3 [Paracoccaceae bacterium]MBR29394.1 cytochrome c oxidase subunit 3 [Paracoccaceae bacterium]SDW70469.1 cytochrome c oxidase subunit 3 [Albimonas donghaensis]
MAHEKNHDYHILSPSPWPLAGAAGAFVMLGGAVAFMHDGGPWIMLIGLAGVLYTMYAWWSDVVAESRAGDHTPVVQIGLRYGVIMFIISEVMFFVAWFWSFFKHAMYPMGEIQGTEVAAGVWPPVGIETFDPWHLPLINTLILLLSGCLATWAHHAIAHDNDRKTMANALVGAVALGVLFTITQAYEYGHAAFGFSGNIYGANFYMATGFHGFHVIVGTIFLAVCMMRAYAGHFTADKHIGFEAAAWYWHFVDVVWLFLFAAVYIWGG